MTTRGDIQTALRAVVGTTALLGETWQYRELTSGPAAETRTYGSWTDIVGHVTARMHSLEYDERRGAEVRQERARFRVSDASIALYQGDQLKDPSSVIYAVMGIESSGVGSVAYSIQRDIPLKVGPNRGGGI